MMDELDLPPLSPEAAALFEAERRRPDPPSPIQAQLWARIAATVSVGPGSGGDSGGTPSAGPPPSSLPTPIGGAGAGAAAALRAAGTGGLLLKPGFIVAFVLGAAAGTVTTLLVQHGRGTRPAIDSRPSLAAPPPMASAAIAASRAPGPAPASSPVASLAPPQGVRAPASRPGRRVHARTRVSDEDPPESLAAERRLVELARTALARSRPADAVAALEQHRKRFPRGQLAEERDGLHVLARAASGELQRAREEARSFKRRYPRSLLLPAIEAALAQGSREE
jgi:hypothetical protein